MTNIEIKKKKDRFLSRKTLGHRWETTDKTLVRMEGRGLLTPIKIGPRMVRYRLSEIEGIERDGESANAGDSVG